MNQNSLDPSFSNRFKSYHKFTEEKINFSGRVGTRNYSNIKIISDTNNITPFLCKNFKVEIFFIKAFYSC